MATVLIVDDDPDLVAQLRAFLIDEGHMVRTARNGVEALDRLLRAPVQLVVSDLAMPAVDGHSLIEEMRRRGDRTPVLLMSGYDHRIQETENMRFIRKPFELNDMLNAVNWAVSLERAAGRSALR